MVAIRMERNERNLLLLGTNKSRNDYGSMAMTMVMAMNMTMTTIKMRTVTMTMTMSNYVRRC